MGATPTQKKYLCFSFVWAVAMLAMFLYGIGSRDWLTYSGDCDNAQGTGTVTGVKIHVGWWSMRLCQDQVVGNQTLNICTSQMLRDCSEDADTSEEVAEILLLHDEFPTSTFCSSWTKTTGFGQFFFCMGIVVLFSEIVFLSIALLEKAELSHLIKLGSWIHYCEAIGFTFVGTLIFLALDKNALKYPSGVENCGGDLKPGAGFIVSLLASLLMGVGLAAAWWGLFRVSATTDGSKKDNPA